jgi:hypothetical protein
MTANAGALTSLCSFNINHHHLIAMNHIDDLIYLSKNAVPAAIRMMPSAPQ